MKNYPFCSVIVLNYYGEKILRNTIQSLLNLNYPKKRFEIIIVDNASKDQSLTIINNLVKKHANIRKVFLEKNLGFATGNNAGVRKSRGKYVALLNNDAYVDRNWLSALVEVAEKSSTAFGITSKILITNNAKHPQSPKKRFIQNAGSIVFQDGYGRDIGSVIENNTQSYEEDMGQFDKIREVYSICGAACLIRKRALKKLGYLDESFFFYYEDTEISERARFAGYTLLYAPKAVVYHLHAYSSREWSPFFIYNAEKGRLLHVFYNFPVRVFIEEYTKFTIFAVGRFFGFKGDSTTKLLRLVFYILLIIPALYKLLQRETKIFHPIRVNIQYLKVSFYIFFNFPRLLIYRLQKHRFINKKVIQENYISILRGKWYFN